MQQRERYKPLYSSYTEGCPELQLSREVSNGICRKRSFLLTALFCGALWQDLQLLQTLGGGLGWILQKGFLPRGWLASTRLPREVVRAPSSGSVWTMLSGTEFCFKRQQAIQAFRRNLTNFTIWKHIQLLFKLFSRNHRVIRQWFSCSVILLFGLNLAPFLQFHLWMRTNGWALNTRDGWDHLACSKP